MPLAAAIAIVLAVAIFSYAVVPRHLLAEHAAAIFLMQVIAGSGILVLQSRTGGIDGQWAHLSWRGSPGQNSCPPPKRQLRSAEGGRFGPPLRLAFSSERPSNGDLGA